jgi:hypothetical protein
LRPVCTVNTQYSRNTNANANANNNEQSNVMGGRDAMEGRDNNKTMKG